MARTGACWAGLGYSLGVAATETLRVVLDAGSTTRRLDELSTARVILKIAEQVHAAQQKAGAGKAIGPLTPSSITIETATGAVKLGLAEPNAFAYAAPEQLGADSGDRRSDVWSLGVVMWEALTHTTLFEGGDDDAVKAAVRQQTIDPPGSLNANIPAELGAICMRALARNPADRYQSAKVMGAELEAVLDDAGYGDTDEKIREYMAVMGQPKRELKITTPPIITPAQGVGVAEVTQPTSHPPEMLVPPPGPASQTAPGVVIPRGDQPPAKSAATPITVSRSANGTQPPPSGEPSPPSSAKPATAPPPIAEPSKGANLASALANAGKQERIGMQTIASAAVPMPKTQPLPRPPILPSETAPGFHSDQVKTPPLDDARVTQVSPALAKPVEVAEIPSLVVAPKTEPKRTDPTPMAEVKKRAGTNPDPVAAVALPAARDSQGVLGGWGWATDSHPAIKQYDPAGDDDDEPAVESSSKKTLLYVFGGGLALVAIVIVVVFAFGGSKPEAPKEQAAVMTGSGSAAIAYGSGVEYGSATGDPTGGSAVIPDAAIDLGSGSAVAAVVPVDAAIAPDAAVIAVVPPVIVEKPKPVPPPPVVVEKPKPKPVEKKPEPPHHVAEVKPKPPVRIAEGPSAAAKADAETAYRQGVQQFARGDANGALTSLRAALASNPGYAPTWRALGLVFEKTGEKDQAKAAFKRYLQLSPGAPDGDQIRNRMERL